MNDPYIKLSRVRTDMGIKDRQGTKLFKSELGAFPHEELTQLRAVLVEECEDIQYQIKLEQKKCEKNPDWMYGCRNSKRARNSFIGFIDEILKLDPKTDNGPADVFKAPAPEFM